MPDILSRIVEVCIFALRDEGPEFLLLKRSPSEKLHPGLWQWVSGAVEAGETAIQAARREMAEETGIIPGSLWVVPHVSAFYDPARDCVSFTPVFAARVAPGAAPKLSAEHSEYLWCDYRVAAGKLVWPGQHEALRVVRDFILPGGETAGRSRIV